MRSETQGCDLIAPPELPIAPLPLAGSWSGTELLAPEGVESPVRCRMRDDDAEVGVASEKQLETTVRHGRGAVRISAPDRHVLADRRR